jgi:hypothetical protein
MGLCGRRSLPLADARSGASVWCDRLDFEVGFCRSVSCTKHLSRVRRHEMKVREKAAFDCIRLATDCLAKTASHISEKTPGPKTRTQDQLFAMKAEQLKKSQILRTSEGSQNMDSLSEATRETGVTPNSVTAVGYPRRYAPRHLRIAAVRLRVVMRGRALARPCPGTG